MARLPELTAKAALPAEAHAGFDAMAGTRGGIVGPCDATEMAPPADWPRLPPRRV